MFALKSVFWGGRVRRKTKMPVEIGRPGSAASHSAGEGMVLPRIMRKPARVFTRLLADGADTPRYAATFMTAALLSATGLYGAVLGGHMPSVVQAVTARTGFAVEEIKISGHRQLSEIDVVGELELNGWTSLLGYSAHEAQSRITDLAWVETASVRKIYPSTLEIKIVERRPFAIWQNGSKLALIERDGNVITTYPGGEFATVPLVVGLGAPEKATEIVSKVAEHPELAAKVKAYIRIADRRWDLRLDNGISVRLPATGEKQAIFDLAELDKRQDLLRRDIASVDMRLGDRMVIGLTSEALDARQTVLKEQAAKRRREKKI
ncbi:MAG: cell division protein FtsQ/DivIB [Rhizobiaceae bacterium]